MKWRNRIPLADECRLKAVHADEHTADVLKRAAAEITRLQTRINEITRICSDD